MLAEAFAEACISFYLSDKLQPELLYRLDLLGLYRRFIDSKYDIFFKEKSKFQPGNMGADEIRESESKTIQLEHHLLALEALFTEDQLTFLHSYDRTTISDEKLARIGIARRNNEGKPHFIHRTFAEYFVADFLVKQLTKKTKQHIQVKELLLNEVLLHKDCHVIRAFLNGKLENSRPSTEALKEYGDLLNEKWNKGGKVQGTLLFGTTALHEAAAEDNTHIIGFLLDSLKSGEHSKALKVMLLSKDYERRTAWLVAAEAGHVKVVEILWIWVKAQLNPREFLLGEDRGEITAWHGAAQWGRVEILIKLWDCVKELQLKPEELRDVLWVSKGEFIHTPWHLAAIEGHVEVLEKLWDWAKELQLKPEELRDEVWLSRGPFNKRAWDMAVGFDRVEVLEKLWDWAKDLQLQPEECRTELWSANDKFLQASMLRTPIKRRVNE
jgi:hypothetical protein